MNGTDELERQISQRLHGHSRLAPANDGWEAILDRIEHRGRARHRRRAVVTGLALAGIVGSLVILAGNDGTRLSTTPARPTAPTAGGAPAAAGALPRLVLDLPGGFDLTYASASEAVDDGPRPDSGPILVYGAPGDGLLGPGPVLFVRLVPAGIPYGTGDGPQVKEVDVAGRPGHLFAIGNPALSLAWARADGSVVHLLAVGLADDDILAAGAAIEEALAAGQAPPTTVAGGIELRRSTPADTSRGGQAEVKYESGTRTVSLRMAEGGAYRLDDLVFDRLASSASWRPTTVGGQPAVLSTYQGPAGVGGSTLMWAVADGVVAELAANDLSDAEIEAAAASIHQVDEDMWRGLVATYGPVPGTVPPVVGPDPVTEVMSLICQDRSEWLHARAVGDRDLEATAVAELSALLEKSRLEGLGETGDILVVAQRILDAMAAGDEAAVSSIPEGGACS